MLLLILSSVIAVAISFYSSMAESMLLSLDKIRLETLKRQKKPYSETVLNMKNNIGKPLAAILILNNIGQTGGAIIAGSAFERIYGEGMIWLFSAGFTLIILFGTEIIPKTLGVAYNERLIPGITPALKGLIVVFMPLIYITNKITLALQKNVEEDKVKMEDIYTMAQVATAEQVIEKEQKDIIINATRITEITAQEAMVPRQLIVFLNDKKGITENFEIAKNNLHTRYPISKSDSPDEIYGYINFKELASFVPHVGDLNIDDFIRPVLTVDKEMPLDEVLKEFISRRHHFAIVIDKSGAVAGMIIMEDIVEEIVGDIKDELDEGKQKIVLTGHDVWTAGGGLSMKEIGEKFKIDLNNEELKLTLSDWLEKIKGNKIDSSTSVDFGDLRFYVQKIRNGRAQKIFIKKIRNNN